MTRSIPEWIAKHDDQAVPPRVRLRVFAAHDGICHISGRKIAAGERWELEHKVALCNGGQHRESNLAPDRCRSRGKENHRPQAQEASRHSEADAKNPIARLR
jgi:hypothetical protein